MSKEISIHFERLETPVADTVRNSTLEWVFIVNPPNENPFPGKKVVARIQDSLEEGLVSLGAAGARAWWERNGARVGSIVNYIYTITTCNEPNAEASVANAYMSEWIDLCRSRHPGLKIAAGHFSRGCPEPETAPEYTESFGKADFICFHEYWAPEMWQDLPTHAGWQMWRYKKFMSNLPLGLQAKPILITECGCDAPGGWRDFYPSQVPYVADIAAYRDGLDDRVQAVFIYEAGPWEKWTRYEVDVPLAEAIIALNVQEEEEVEVANQIRVKTSSGIVFMDIEEYVKGVVPSEVYSSWPKEILRAQAVAARTYALAQRGRHGGEGYDLCNTTHCQVYSHVRSVACSQAVDDTFGVVGIHRTLNKIVPTFFSAACGGALLGNWGDYLRARTDCPCKAQGKAINGHQNGLCQWGGKYLADAGRTWLEILDFYYDLLWVKDYGTGEVLNSHSPVSAPSSTELAALTVRVANLEAAVAKFRVVNIEVVRREG